MNWFQTLHQEGTVFNQKMKVEISGTMAATLVLSVVAFTLLYGYLVAERMELLAPRRGLRGARARSSAIAERLEHGDRLMDHNWGYVAAGYGLTTGVVVAYTGVAPARSDPGSAGDCRRPRPVRSSAP